MVVTFSKWVPKYGCKHVELTHGCTVLYLSVSQRKYAAFWNPNPSFHLHCLLSWMVGCPQPFCVKFYIDFQDPVITCNTWVLPASRSLSVPLPGVVWNEVQSSMRRDSSSRIQTWGLPSNDLEEISKMDISLCPYIKTALHWGQAKTCPSLSSQSLQLPNVVPCLLLHLEKK